MRSQADPILSVIVVVHRSSRRLEACLKALVAQDTETPFEIVVADGTVDPGTASVCAAFPKVIRVACSDRQPGQIRNTGMRIARGDLIAFLYVDCTAPTGWVESILSEHRTSPAKIISGPIGNGCPDHVVATAAYFCEFYPWTPGHPARYVEDFPACNLTYQRAVLEQAGGFSDATFGSDADLHQRVRQQGVTGIYCSPRLMVYFHPIEHARECLGHLFETGRNYAAGRVRHVSRSHRWLYALLFWTLPWVFMARGLRCLWPNPALRYTFLIHLPLILIGWTFQAAGEAAGYICGVSDR